MTEKRHADSHPAGGHLGASFLFMRVSVPEMGWLLMEVRVLVGTFCLVPILLWRYRKQIQPSLFKHAGDWCDQFGPAFYVVGLRHHLPQWVYLPAELYRAAFGVLSLGRFG